MDASQHYLLDACQAWDQLRLVGPHAAPACGILILQHVWAGAVAAAVMVPQRFGMLLERRQQSPVELNSINGRQQSLCLAAQCLLTSHDMKARVGAVTHLSQNPPPQPEISIP